MELWHQSRHVGPEGASGPVDPCPPQPGAILWPDKPTIIDASTLSATPKDFSIDGGAGGLLAVMGIFSGVQISPTQENSTTNAVTGRWVTLIPGMAVPNRSPLWLRTIPGESGSGLIYFALFRYPGRQDPLSTLALLTLARTFAGAGGGAVISGPGSVPSTSGIDSDVYVQADNATGSQIFQSGTAMPVGGATKPCSVIIDTPNNANLVLVAKSNPPTGGWGVTTGGAPIGALGEPQSWNMNSGEKLYFFGVGGSQNIAWRVRA